MGFFGFFFCCFLFLFVAEEVGIASAGATGDMMDTTLGSLSVSKRVAFGGYAPWIFEAERFGFLEFKEGLTYGVRT